MNENETKKEWYKSKTMIINIIALIIVIIESQAGFGLGIPPTTQISFLAVLNLFLRMITHEGVK